MSHALRDITLSRVLVLGSRGMVGRAWTGLLCAHGIAYDALGRDRFDLTDQSLLEATDFSRYDLVVNCAAWTDVDGAEAQYEDAHLVNAEAVVLLGKACARAGTRFVTYSTDYVFNGCGAEPYQTDETRDPINAYGRSKAQGEEGLRALANEAHADNWLCIRTSWVYAPWGKNFVRTIAGLAQSRSEIQVVSDQHGRPTSAEGLARTSLALVLADATGFFHATDVGACSWFEFAREIVRLIGADCQVRACSSDAFPRPAKRPHNSVLDLSKTEELVGAMIPWQHALADVVRRMGITKE